MNIFRPPDLWVRCEGCGGYIRKKRVWEVTADRARAHSRWRASLDPDFDRRLSDWMRRAQDGDREAYETLLTEVTAYLTQFVRKRLKEPDGIDDVVQETLIIDPIGLLQSLANKLRQ